MDDIQTLMQMGFDKAMAERALAETQGQGLDAAVNWIFSNPAPMAQSGGFTLGSGSGGQQQTSAGSTGDATAEQQSAQQQGQQQPEQSQQNAEGEAPAPKKALTEEEKQEQARKLQEKINQRRIQRHQEEEKRQLEQQKKRMESAKTLSQARREQEELEMKRIAEQKRKEKLENKRRKERIKAELEKDKAEREAARKEAERQQSRPSSLPVAPTPAVTAPPSTTATSCRIQVRLPGAQPLRATFSPDDKLQKLFDVVSASGAAPANYSLMQTIPRRSFAPTADADTSFRDAGLVPSASLHLKPIL
ncbi:hypothetical protein PTSG_06259 [Salpingoeca rosetta]|uniref:UBX domain-containing protein n=1 Tax=Salpingoeca rosetta (strain ATCC 50818 / BSB-021) TaxID=946362 RepID=F2UCE2_SALR5|nr:uncharacterized protein PTSG_06259 [Salpingoeca rosetta]EGD74249.1 hypothetical protein PTSG_06259 [Salpingoeca rosetta]|eukprot:XP_004993149.1 hypothetical protein PTSG_06259 [Salpingoeca rosetta]